MTPPLEGKTGVIFGVANKRSIAWGIAQALNREGARIALTYKNERMEDGVRKLASELPGDTFLCPCDVTVAGDIERCFEAIGDVRTCNSWRPPRRERRSRRRPCGEHADPESRECVARRDH